MNTQQTDSAYIANTYARFPVAIHHGKGSLVWDEDGRQYIDLSGGIAVNTFGFADDEWIAAVTAQLGAVQHTSNLYYTAPCAKLAEALCLRSGMKKVFFSNSGAEANECAIKAARKYAAEKKGSDYFTIVTLKNSFHGRTLTTLAATGQEVFHKDFTPLTPGFVHADPDSVEDVERLIRLHKCAAVMLEVVQGEGGVQALRPEFVSGVATLCAAHDLLLIADEVQIGNGRSGKLWGYMNYGVQPAIVTTAKGLGGGLPIGATMLGERVQDVFTPGAHGSTFGGNPVCCAGALNILGRLNDELLEGVCKKSDFIRKSLAGAPGEVIADCIGRGLLVIRAKNKVRLLPALNIPDDLLTQAVEILKAACAQP